MANDRLILHSESGKELVIARHFNGEWHLYNGDDFGDLCERIQAMFDDDFYKHGRCVYWLSTEFCECAYEHSDENDWFYSTVSKIARWFGKAFE